MINAGYLAIVLRFDAGFTGSGRPFHKVRRRPCFGRNARRKHENSTNGSDNCQKCRRVCESTVSTSTANKFSLSMLDEQISKYK